MQIDKCPHSRYCGDKSGDNAKDKQVGIARGGTAARLVNVRSQHQKSKKLKKCQKLKI